MRRAGYERCYLLIGILFFILSIGGSTLAWGAAAVCYKPGKPESLESSPDFKIVVQAPHASQKRRQLARDMLVGSGIAATAVTGLLTYRYYTWTQQNPEMCYDHEMAMWAELGPATTALGAALTTTFVNPYMVAMTIGDPIKRWGSTVYGWLRGINPIETVESENKTMERKAKYESYIKSRTDLPAGLQDRLLSEVQAIHPGTGSLSEAVFTGVSYLLSFPYERKEYGDIADPSNAKLLNLKASVEKVKAHYPDDIQESIDSFVVDILTQAKKPVIHLQGSKGTGKTFFAEELSTAMGLPLIKISPGERSERIFNPTSYGSSLNGFSAKEMSQLAEAFAQTPLINGKKIKGIIFFDEVEKLLEDKGSYDKIALTKLLELLEPSRSEWYIKELGFTYDISGYAFILAGNAPIKNEALKSRIKTILFKGFPLDKKKEIAWSKFNRLVTEKQKQLPQFTPTAEELTFVDNIIAADSNEGVRELLGVLEEYVGFLIKKRLSHLFPNQDGKTFGVQVAFQQRGTPGEEEEMSLENFKPTPEEEDLLDSLVDSINEGKPEKAIRRVSTYMLKQRKVHKLQPASDGDSLEVPVCDLATRIMQDSDEDLL